MKDIYHVIPPVFRDEITKNWDGKSVEELRFRRGQCCSFVAEGQEEFLMTPVVLTEHLDFILARACDFSVHAVQNQISRGFLTIKGGHRIGLCGTVFTENGKIKTISPLSSVSIRLAREVLEISTEILPALCGAEGFENSLILSAPGQGKTTLLRDLLRKISNGEGITSYRMALLDERGEIAGMQQGKPRFDVGRRTDVLEGCAKAEGFLFMLRSMNPEILVADEITAKEDVQAMEEVLGCGVKLLVTAHGREKKDLFQRPVYKKMMELGIFKKLIRISMEQQQRRYWVEELP